MTATTARMSARDRRRLERAPWGGPQRHYDIVKEAIIAVVAVAVLTVALAIVFSSPDKPAVTLKAWATSQPVGFVDTAMSELDGSSTSASYGPPYNSASGSVQSLGPVSLQKAAGIRIPVDAASSFVLDPLKSLPAAPTLSAALSRYISASTGRQGAWQKAYEADLAKSSLGAGLPSLSAGNLGPLPVLMSSLLGMARSGALDAALVTHGSFYNTDATRPLLFLGDSATGQDNSYWNQIVGAEHLQGSQWGVMNETGSWPGQPWLWLYTLWYQVSPIKTSGNADVLVLALMAVASLLLLAVPFLPGVRSLPRLIPIHRLIWRRYYCLPS
jgi:hypothetical protein